MSWTRNPFTASNAARHAALATGIVAVVALAAFATARAENPPAPTTSQFCTLAIDLYQRILGAPLKGDRKTAEAAITYGIYRNAAASRVLQMGWAGRCDMSQFLRMENDHEKTVSGIVSINPASNFR